MILEAGELDTRATFYRKATKQSPETGAVLDGWDRMGTRWIKFTPLTYRNAEIGRGFSPTTTHEAKLDFYADVTAGCRVAVRGVQYEVAGVVNDTAERPQWTNLFLEVAA